MAEKMRSGRSAAQILNQSVVRFDDGTWYVSVGDAQFRFSQRNRVVVSDTPAAVEFQYRD